MGSSPHSNIPIETFSLRLLFQKTGSRERVRNTPVQVYRSFGPNRPATQCQTVLDIGILASFLDSHRSQTRMVGWAADRIYGNTASSCWKTGLAVIIT